MIGDVPLTRAEIYRRWRQKDPERYKAIRAASRERHALKIAEYNRAYYNDHQKELSEKALARNNARYRTSPGHRQRVRAAAVRRMYGITVEDVQRMLVEQDGKCLVCAEQFQKTPCVDHDHKSGEVRGLLCGLCNLGLGKFRDDPRIVARALWYLTRQAKTKTG